jgi:uncharacterized coiled-coil protein SlyX
MSDDFMHVDPAKQRAFIEGLNRRIYNIEQIIEILESRMRALGRDWRDQEFEAFAHQATRTAQVLKTFVGEGRKVSLQLSQAASLGEQYQHIKL